MRTHEHQPHRLSRRRPLPRERAKPFKTRATLRRNRAELRLARSRIPLKLAQQRSRLHRHASPPDRRPPPLRPPHAHDGSSQPPTLGEQSSTASPSARNHAASPAPSALYHTVRPRFSLDTSPALASVAKCRATTEKSTEQHAATSLTEHGRPHFNRHDNNRPRVGSASAFNFSGSSNRSNRARRRNACRGVIVSRLHTDAMLQV